MKSWPKIKVFFFNHKPSREIVATNNALVANALYDNKNFKLRGVQKAYVAQEAKYLYAQYPYSYKQKAQEVSSKQGAADVIVLALIFVLCALA